MVPGRADEETGSESAKGDQDQQQVPCPPRECSSSNRYRAPPGSAAAATGTLPDHAVPQQQEVPDSPMPPAANNTHTIHVYTVALTKLIAH